MKALAQVAEAEGVNLELENEKGIYGDLASRQLEIVEHVGSKNFRAAFDFGNFVECGQDPIAAWNMLRKYVVDFHIKDVKHAVRAWSQSAKAMAKPAKFSKMRSRPDGPDC